MPPVERAFFSQPIAYAGGRVIASPFQFATSGEDNLRIVSQNAAANVRIAVQGRRLNAAGEIVTFAFVHTPNTDRTVKTTVESLGVGALLNVAVFIDNGSPTYGQVFVMIQIVRGFSGPLVLLGTLLAGVVTTTQSLGWPGSPISSAIDLLGYPRSVTGSTPAAGVEWSETVPTGARWVLERCSAILTTSATPNSRYVRFQVRSVTGDVQLSVHAQASQGAGIVGTYSWGDGVSGHSIAVAAQHDVSLPVPLLLTAGQMFGTSTLNFAADDQWSAPAYSATETLEPA